MKLPSPLTQAQLDYLFRRLGYRLTEVKGGPRVWENPEFNAVMLLPATAPEQPARLHHLLALRRIAIETGIVGADVFDALLDDARQYGTDPIGSHNVA
jgi:hypothetical protein